ncbi:MAG: TetR/AcrR family transcriptional regulator [Burkholderiaceae bacterium]
MAQKSPRKDLCKQAAVFHRSLVELIEHAVQEFLRESALNSLDSKVDRLRASPYITDQSVITLSMLAHPPTRQRRKEARPQELLDAALDLFVEKGFAATRSEEVAQRAGVSKGTLYLYYPSKEELLKEVIRHNMVHEIAKGLDTVAQFSGPSAELLTLIYQQWWEHIGETRASGIMKLMISEVRNFPEIAQFYADEVIQPTHELLTRLLERGIERGEFRHIDVAHVVHALVAPMLFLMLHKHSIGACGVCHSIDPRAVIAAHLDLVLNGLQVAPPSPAKTRAAAVKKAAGTKAKEARLP